LRGHRPGPFVLGPKDPGRTVQGNHVADDCGRVADDCMLGGSWKRKKELPILYIHGGPHIGCGHMYSFDFQMLAGAGYAVLFINYRGSTGYGDEFSTKIIGDYGNLDYKDLMAGVDFAIEKGIADPERLGCCGLSYGGYMAW